MFKRRIAGVCAVLLIAGLIAGIRLLNGIPRDARSYSETEETSVTNEELEQLFGVGLQTVAENEFLRVDLNFDDGNIEVTNKDNGYIWRSRPDDEELDRENSNDMWKNNLKSPVVFGYIQDFTQSSASYGNVYALKNQISVYRLSDGIRVYFEFPEVQITFAYELALSGDSMRVTVPSHLISDTGPVYTQTGTGARTIDKSKTFLLTDFMLFPFLGAEPGGSGADGYLFVPDGPGGIMDFSVDGNATAQYIGHIYGSDLALLNNYDNTIYEEMRRAFVAYPVYGLVKDGNSMLAIIDEGETQADIIASKAGVQTGFHTVGSRFGYRLKYKLVTNTVTGDGYFTYSDFCVEEKRSILYHFGSGEDADYVGMAKVYREYLIDKNGIGPLERRAPLQLYIVCGDVKTNLLGKSFLQATTFDEAKEIVLYFKENGIEDMDVILSGWAKNGGSVRYPDRYPVPAALGGEAGLESLSDYVKDLGYRFYLQDTFISLYSRKGVSIRKDTAYNVQDNSILEGSFSGAEFAEEQFHKSLKRYEKIGADGIEEVMLGYYLYSDFGRGIVMSREKMKEAQIALAKEMAMAGGADEAGMTGGVRLTRPAAYLVRETVHFTSFPDSSYYNIIDETVPFYAVVLHGLAEYDYGSYNNEFFEPDQQFLKAIEYGAGISFQVTREPAEVFRQSDSSFYYSTQFDIWKERILKLLTRYERYQNAAGTRLIDDYEKLAKDVTKVSYEGGVAVVINYSAEPYDYGGRTVPGLDFIIVEQEEDR